MKTLLLIIGTAAMFTLAKSNKARDEKQTTVASASYSDSLFEAGRVEVMKSKML